MEMDMQNPSDMGCCNMMLDLLFLKRRWKVGLRALLIL
jgi:hypothetical protein